MNRGPDPVASLPPPPATPPPPPPPYYPAPGGGWGPTLPPTDWAPYTPRPPPSPTASIRRVRDGVSLYRLSVLLGILIQAASVALLLIDPAVGRFASLSAAGSFSVPSGAASIGGAALELDLLVAALALASFIVGLIAFLRWRDGVKDLRLATRSANPLPSMVTSGPAAEADRGYTRAVWTLLACILTLIAGVVVIFALTLGSLAPVLHPNGTLTAPGPGQIASAVQIAVRAGVGLAVVLLALELLLTYFVTESLHGVVTSGGYTGGTVGLGSARVIALVAVGIAATGLLNFVVTGLGAVAVVGPLLLLVACQRYLVAFDQRLGSAAASMAPARSEPS